MSNSAIYKLGVHGATAAAALVGVYVIVVSLVSGQVYAFRQLIAYWPFIVSLALGFGIQVGLYGYLKRIAASLDARMSAKPIVVTGTTSTLAMISCCAHYLVTIAPVLGVTGALSVIDAYQIELFWLGIVLNLIGIILIMKKISFLKKAL